MTTTHPNIARIGQLTNGLTPPRDACPSWTRLYAELGAFLRALEEHVRLENEVLFPAIRIDGDPQWLTCTARSRQRRVADRRHALAFKTGDLLDEPQTRDT